VRTRSHGAGLHTRLCAALPFTSTPPPSPTPADLKQIYLDAWSAPILPLETLDRVEKPVVKPTPRAYVAPSDTD
jgi:hypothetical protein